MLDDRKNKNPYLLYSSMFRDISIAPSIPVSVHNIHFVMFDIFSLLRLSDATTVVLPTDLLYTKFH